MNSTTEKMAIIFIGIQASGKSTFYHERFGEYVHINLDTLHTRNKERLMLQECVANSRPFVVDNTNPTSADREKYIQMAKENGYTIHGYYFQSSVSECIERNRLRTGKAKIPDCAVAATHRKLELPSYEEGFDRLFYVYIETDKFTETTNIPRSWQCKPNGHLYYENGAFIVEDWKETT